MLSVNNSLKSINSTKFHGQTRSNLTHAIPIGTIVVVLPLRWYARAHKTRCAFVRALVLLQTLLRLSLAHVLLRLPLCLPQRRLIDGVDHCFCAACCFWRSTFSFYRMQELHYFRQGGEGDVPCPLRRLPAPVRSRPEVGGGDAERGIERGPGAEEARVLRLAQVQGDQQGRQAAEDGGAGQNGQQGRWEERYEGVRRMRRTKRRYARGHRVESLPLRLRQEGGTL